MANPFTSQQEYSRFYFWACVGFSVYCIFLPPKGRGSIKTAGVKHQPVWKYVPATLSRRENEIKMGTIFLPPFTLEVQYPELSAINDSTRQLAMRKSRCRPWMRCFHIVDFMNQRPAHESVYQKECVKIFKRHVEEFANASAGCLSLLTAKNS